MKKNRYSKLISLVTLIIILSSLISYLSFSKSHDIRSSAKNQTLPSTDVCVCSGGAGATCRKITESTKCVNDSACLWTCPIDVLLTTPNGGETWRQGDTFTITWQQEQSTDNTSLFILYKNLDGTYQYLGAIGYYLSSLVGSNSYSWTIPVSGSNLTTALGNNVIVAVGQYKEGRQVAWDMSNAPFTILPAE